MPSNQSKYIAITFVWILPFLFGCKRGIVISVAGKSYNIAGEYLTSYPCPWNDTLTSSSYLSLSNQFIEYNECVCGDKYCDTRLKVTGNLAKFDEPYYRSSEIILSHENNMKGYLLSIYDNSDKQIFTSTTYNSDGSIEETPSGIVNIICKDKRQAEDIIKELRTFITINSSE